MNHDGKKMQTSFANKNALDILLQFFYCLSPFFFLVFYCPSFCPLFLPLFCICFSAPMGFISSLPQLTWELGLKGLVVVVVILLHTYFDTKITKTYQFYQQIVI
jgi:hypothetical protein